MSSKSKMCAVLTGSFAEEKLPTAESTSQVFHAISRTRPRHCPNLPSAQPSSRKTSSHAFIESGFDWDTECWPRSAEVPAAKRGSRFWGRDDLIQAVSWNARCALLEISQSLVLEVSVDYVFYSTSVSFLP